MRKILIGQCLLILCCMFYLIWWYRGYRPGVSVDRAGGINGLLLMITAAFGMAGVFSSLIPVPVIEKPKVSSMLIVTVGIISYILLVFITRGLFQRIVTTELMLIVGWTMLEMTVINRLSAAGFLTDGNFAVMCAVIAAAFAVSMVLYVAYYRMEEMKAFYAAMVPLVTEAASMLVLVSMLLTRNRGS